MPQVYSSRICIENGCNRSYYCRGYCKLHYEKKRRAGAYPARVVRKYCTFSGCEMRHMARGFCHYHYREKYQTLYNIWYQMIRRCTYPRHPEFNRYGKRGVKVCEQWIKSWTKFAEDMGPKPHENYSLDRIDVDGDYTPLNCRWADKTVQSINQRTRRDNKIGIKGVYYDKTRNKYTAEIKLNGEHIHLGRFSVLEEAIAARKNAEMKYHQPLLVG